MKPTGITDPDVAHDTMMDDAAEAIGGAEHFDDFWKKIKDSLITEDHAQQLWADHIENQADKWGEGRI